MGDSVAWPGTDQQWGAGEGVDGRRVSLQPLKVLPTEKGVELFSLSSKGKIRGFAIPKMTTSERQILLCLRKNSTSWPMSQECS